MSPSPFDEALWMRGGCGDGAGRSDGSDVCAVCYTVARRRRGEIRVRGVISSRQMGCMMGRHWTECAIPRNEPGDVVD